MGIRDNQDPAAENQIGQTGIDPDILEEVDFDGRDIHLKPEFVAQVIEAIRDERTEELGELVENLHAADQADLFQVLPPQDRRSLAALSAEHLDPEFLSELEGAAREDVIDVIPAGVVAEAVQQLDTDDAVDVLEDMNAEAQRAVLQALSADDRTFIEEGLAYPEETAGRLMQRDLIAVPQFWTVGQTIDFLRAEQDNLPTDFYDLIVVDPFHKPVGMVPLSRVLKTKRPSRIGDIMIPEPHLVHVGADQEEVAYQFNKYHLISAAVIDDSGRLVGVITVDDIVDVIEEEAQEDILAMAGVSEGDLNDSIFDMTRTRFIWLVVNLGTAILASMVIGLFDTTINELVALAILMPIVASMGGNAGTQTMTVAVRALATKELSRSNALRIVNKELIVSVINGILLALLVGGAAYLWFGNELLSAILAAAMIVNMIVAGLSGIMIPMTLERFGVDPAVASSVFVTTITDVVGFFVFLGLAASILL